MKALVIEDEDGIQAALRLMLQPFVSELKFAKTMNEAMATIADSSQIELITIDLGLPGSEIEDVINHSIRQIRESKPDALIIIVTGQTIENLEQRVLDQGADGLILKQGNDFSQAGFLKLLTSLATRFVKEPKHYTRSIEVMEKVQRKIGELSHLAVA